MSLIVYEKQDSIAVIKLNRPEVYNAMNADMWDGLREALGTADKDDEIRVIVITTAGPHFSTGADLKAPRRQLAEGELSPYSRCMIALGVVEKILVAAVRGYTLGAGLELMTQCDLVIAAETSQIGAPEVMVGITPNGGTTRSLPMIVGLSKAKEMIFTGERISGLEAHRIGLANQVVPAEQLENAAIVMARKVARGAPIPLRLVKKLLNRTPMMDRDSAMRLEREAIAVCMASKDFEEARTAFAEKRPPVFKGK